MAFDADAAWADLAAHIESREGHGSKTLLATMRELETKHRLREGLLERVLRLYRGGVQIVAINPADAGPAGGLPVEPEDAKGTGRTVEDPEEDRDEHRSNRNTGTRIAA